MARARLAKDTGSQAWVHHNVPGRMRRSWCEAQRSHTRCPSPKRLPRTVTVPVVSTSSARSAASERRAMVRGGELRRAEQEMASSPKRVPRTQARAQLSTGCAAPPNPHERLSKDGLVIHKH